MNQIMVEWLNGAIEEVDSEDSEAEAIYLVNEYRMAFGASCKRIWIQHRK